MYIDLHINKLIKKENLLYKSMSQLVGCLKSYRIIINYYDYLPLLLEFLCDFTNEFIITAFRNKPSIPFCVFCLINFLFSNVIEANFYSKAIISIISNGIEEKRV